MQPKPQVVAEPLLRRRPPRQDGPGRRAAQARRAPQGRSEPGQNCFTTKLQINSPG